MRSRIANLIGVFIRLRLESRLYLLGALLVGSGIALHAYAGQLSGDFAWAFGCFLLGVGFIVWVYPRIRSLWRNIFFRRLLLYLHVGVLIAAAAVATSVMSSATGLHGRDFPIAVSVISLIIYPVVWLWIATLCVGVFAIIMQALIFSRFMIAHIMNVLPLDRFVDRSKIAPFGIAKPLGHVMGALSLLIGIAVVAEALEANVPRIQNFGLLVAYLGDYQQVQRMPGISPGSHVVMHGEGVYSVAVLGDWGKVSVNVYRLPQD